MRINLLARRDSESNDILRHSVEFSCDILTPRDRASRIKTYRDNARSRLFCGITKAPFTLLRFHMKTEQNLSALAMRSHCSTVKTELFENANENA